MLFTLVGIVTSEGKCIDFFLNCDIILLIRQFVTILSLNKTIGKDGHICVLFVFLTKEIKK